MKADLHVHTTYSFDSAMKLDDIVKRSLQVGINCLAVTDHGTIEGALRLREMAPFPVIVGQEILTSRGEVMGFFLKEAIPKGLAPLQATRLVKEQGGLFGIPHPFDRIGRWGLPHATILELLPQIDIFEVFNSRTLFFWDSSRARRFAQEHHLLASAGSDAHVPWEIGRAFVEMPQFQGPEDFRQALAQGRIYGHHSLPWPHMIGLWTRLKRNL